MRTGMLQGFGAAGIQDSEYNVLVQQFQLAVQMHFA
jgi:hypothetical protein